MGMMSLGAPDIASDVLAGTISGTAGSTASNTSFKAMFGRFNASLYGTWVGTVQLQKSYDAGATWLATQKDVNGTSGTYTTNVIAIWDEPEPGVYYRWQCTVALSSGSVSWRLSGGPRVS